MSIGETLAHARHQAGLTIAEVSQRTRIRQHLIEGIERDDFSECGGDFYTRGHIRSIARAVGIDPEPLIQQYDRDWREPDTLTSEVQRLVTESRATLAAEPGEGATLPGIPEEGVPSPREPDEGATLPAGPASPAGGPGTPPADPGIRLGEPGTPPARPAIRLGEPGPPPAGPRPGVWQPGALPPRPVIPPRRPRRNWALVLAAVAVVALGIAGYALLASPGPAAPVASAPRSHPVTRHPAVQGSAAPARQRGQRTSAPGPTPTPAAPSSPAGPARVLAPASAAAFGSGGAGAGDNSGLAHLAVDGSRASAWHTDWYTSATFGNLYRGTGLLLDMGHQVTITGVQVALGGAPGAQFQVRVGPEPALGSLRPVAGAGDAGGQVRLRLAQPAHGRYLLIWFTRLPADASGTYQVSVHDVTVTGRP